MPLGNADEQKEPESVPGFPQIRLYV